MTNKKSRTLYHKRHPYWIRLCPQIRLLDTKPSRPKKKLRIAYIVKAPCKITPYYDQASVALDFSILCVLSVYTERITIQSFQEKNFCKS